MEKKTIFLSHISEEGALGTIFKDRLEKDFLSLIDVFVSSDARSIPPGDAWLKAVDTNLEGAAALIVLASPESIARPWITFEAGAGWAKRVPTMIVCHSGITPGGLPLPLGQLQAFQANDIKRMEAMYQVVAKVLGSAVPEPDFTKFIASITDFERSHTEERDVRSALREIHAADPKVLRSFRQVAVGQPTRIGNFPESLVRKTETALNQLMNRGFLNWSYGVTGLAFAGTSGGGGNFGDMNVTITPVLAKYLAESEFA
jgi:hypothetical protein